MWHNADLWRIRCRRRSVSRSSRSEDGGQKREMIRTQRSSRGPAFPSDRQTYRDNSLQPKRTKCYSHPEKARESPEGSVSEDRHRGLRTAAWLKRLNHLQQLHHSRFPLHLLHGHNINTVISLRSSISSAACSQNNPD